jgi:arylsulfatase
MRTWTNRISLSAASLLTGLLGSLATAQDKPNVVIMLGDNVGYGDIGAYGAGEVRGMPTPRIDRLASEGLRLTPSRSG